MDVSEAFSASRILADDFGTILEPYVVAVQRIGIFQLCSQKCAWSYVQRHPDVTDGGQQVSMGV
jgi:hypothetical protein